VVPHKTEAFTADGFRFSLPAQRPGGIPATFVRRLASTGKITLDRTFPAQQAGGPPGQVGHPWSAASFTPYRLVAGHPPASSGEIVVGGGGHGLVGRRVQVTTAQGTSTYTVAGVTAPVWFEHAIFFTDTAAARISPAIDAAVAYRPPAAVRIDRRAYSSILRQATLPADTAIPWWHGRRLHFEFSWTRAEGGAGLN
jgi:putative ABC transport system permease protein